MTLTVSPPVSAVDALRVEEVHRGHDEHPRHYAPDSGLHPQGNGRPTEALPHDEQAIGKGNADRSGGDTERPIQEERARVGEAILLREVEDGVCAQHTSLDHGGERGGDDDSRENRLVELADDLFDRECHGGDRGVERRRDPGRCAYGQETPTPLCRDRCELSEEAGEPGADLDGRAFATERPAGANLNGAEDELSERVAHGHNPLARRVGDLHLRNAAPSRAGDDVLKQKSPDEPAERGGDDGPRHPRVAGRRESAANEHALRERDGEVKRDRSEPACRTDDERHREESLGLGGHQTPHSAQHLHAPELELCARRSGGGHLWVLDSYQAK
jgi:hypothetical protein